MNASSIGYDGIGAFSEIELKNYAKKLRQKIATKNSKSIAF